AWAGDPDPAHPGGRLNQHRDQTDLRDLDILSEIREHWVTLNQRWPLGKPTLRMMLNGTHYGNPDIHGGASQPHVHAQIVSKEFVSERSVVDWKHQEPVGRGRFREGIVMLLPGDAPDDDHLAIALEARGPDAFQRLDNEMHDLLQDITTTPDRNSFDVFYFDPTPWIVRLLRSTLMALHAGGLAERLAPPVVRVYLTGRTRGASRIGGGIMRGTPEVLMLHDTQLQIDRLFRLQTSALQEDWNRAVAATANVTEFIALARRWWSEGKLVIDEAALRQGHREDVRQIAYSRAQVEALLRRFLPSDRTTGGGTGSAEDDHGRLAGRRASWFTAGASFRALPVQARSRLRRILSAA
ncbi:MAG TPA: hypothetical protein VMU17_04180, partial [Elusimicrobiota bacterium]|nr:hypothetical protein [Elusimicrobiota bacterium]